LTVTLAHCIADNTVHYLRIFPPNGLLHKSQKNLWLQRKQPTDETGTLLYTKQLENVFSLRNSWHTVNGNYESMLEVLTLDIVTIDTIYDITACQL